MDCVKRRAVEGLHDDLMVEILSCVPVKDLRRSTCVSKPWRDLITDPLHRKKLPQTLEGFFHGCAGGRHSCGHFTSLLGSGERVPPVDPSFSFLTAKLPGIGRIALLDSCNGLLLFGCTREDKFGYIVCNPATEELMTVPASSSSCPPPPPSVECYHVAAHYGESRYALTFLMFAPVVSSHFHLVQIWKSIPLGEVETVHSYSSETSAWSDRSSMWERVEEGSEWGLLGDAVIYFKCGRALVNGLLHLVARHLRKPEFTILVVDGEGKTCRSIGWHDKDVPEIAFIGHSQDRLHCIGGSRKSQQGSPHTRFTQLSVWVLEDYDRQEWILKHNVTSSQFVGLLSRPVADFDIVAIHPDHNSIILVQHWNKKLVSYNMDSKELCELRPLGKGYRMLTPYVPYFMESLVLATKFILVPYFTARTPSVPNLHAFAWAIAAQNLNRRSRRDTRGS